VTISSLIRNLFEQEGYEVLSIGKRKSGGYSVRTTTGRFIFSRENYPPTFDDSQVKAILSSAS
jgi:hypothetical protein